VKQHVADESPRRGVAVRLGGGEIRVGAPAIDLAIANQQPEF
jgi:hypothetical protein